MKKFLSKRIVRILLNVLSVLAYTLSMGFYGHIECVWLKIVLIIVCCVGVVGNVVLSIYYTTSDKMAEDVLNKAKSDMISYKNMFASLTNLLPEEANEINKIAKNISEKGIVPENRWTFDDCAMHICRIVHGFLKDMCLSEGDVYVYYTKKVEDDNKKVQLVGFYNDKSEAPSNYKVKRSIDEEKAFYDVKMFRESKTYACYKLCSKDVDELLEYKDWRNDVGRFEQCLFIPSFCAGTKMTGVLHVFTSKNVKVATDNEEMEKIIKKLKLFANILLTFQKVEKVALAVPIDKNKNRNKKVICKQNDVKPNTSPSAESKTYVDKYHQKG